MVRKKRNFKLQRLKWRKKFINETETGMYVGKNVDSEDVLVKVSKGKGMEVETLQGNGWWMIHDYNEDGICESEAFRFA